MCLGNVLGLCVKVIMFKYLCSDVCALMNTFGWIIYGEHFWRISSGECVLVDKFK